MKQGVGLRSGTTKQAGVLADRGRATLTLVISHFESTAPKSLQQAERPTNVIFGSPEDRPLTLKRRVSDCAVEYADDAFNSSSLDQANFV
ncbi:hypothetical protein PYCC9005_000263 [Savitreella phatthalungensis]